MSHGCLAYPRGVAALVSDSLFFVRKTRNMHCVTTILSIKVTAGQRDIRTHFPCSTALELQCLEPIRIWNDEVEHVNMSVYLGQSYTFETIASVTKIHIGSLT